MRELVLWFLDDLGNRVQAMRGALDAHDASRLRVLAHQLAGAASGYGFDEIGDAAREVESSIRFIRLQRELEHTIGQDLSCGDDACEDGLEDELELSALSEKAEDLIALCRRAIDGKDGAEA
jgi:HPt (histidine-containing phosphotransfer) domain-containing protein